MKAGLSGSRSIGALVAFIWLAQGTIASAQQISITTPRLEPRGAPTAQPSATGQPSGSGPQPSPGPQSPTGQHPSYGQQPTHGQQPSYGQQPGYGQQTTQPAYGGQPTWGGQPAASSQAPQSTGSPMQQRRGGAASAYGQPYGPQPGPGAASAPVAAVATQPSAAGGTCRAHPSPDRQTISLLGPDGLPRRHIPLGDFRVQQVTHSPDGLWAVAVTKLRGESQFAAMTLDMTACQTSNSTSLPAESESVRFEVDTALITTPQGERRIGLSNARVR
jgi:hypothetical protein